jgi:rhodanese-related sulfurtransferase
MPRSDFWITPAELNARIGTADAPLLVDCRRRAALEDSGRVIAGSQWRSAINTQQWIGAIPADTEVVAYCVHGHNVSQLAASLARAAGRCVRTLRGGLDALVDIAGTTIALQASIHLDAMPSRWVTRERPVVDRMACPWLIKRFIDPRAQILYLEPEQVVPIADELGAIPFDVPDVNFSHRDEYCSFDAFLREFEVADPALKRVAQVVRGADTNRHDIAPEAAGLLALSLGIRHQHISDQAALDHAMPIYDALYAWAKHCHGQSHRWQSAPEST